MTNAQKKEWARLLFLKENMTQKEIAAKVNISEKTMSIWIKKHEWDKLKASFVITKEETLYRLYSQINAINKVIENYPEGEKFATGREADALSKLASAVKTLETETSVADVVDVFTKFLEWLRKIDLKKAQEFVEIQDKYIKTLLK